MRKIEIYSNMLWRSLSYIRNIQTQTCIGKAFNKSCYYEAELLHNVVISIIEEEITSNDIYFLNNQAKFYLEKANKRECTNYFSHQDDIKKLFSIVPEHLKDKLEWDGPE
ncbi:hypothetical protein NA898_15880 [Proteus cibi]|uniref:Zinc ABC transporter substrate-binding protein n=2 Tax=Proteus TaxID=583 RepID=A0A6I7DC69_9GAMM|nr:MULTISPECIES: hypothetical protein [Proteus]MBG2802985.1 hypothetical protein [Proteus mirabilis]MCF1958475.1 hypothetical protein [Escherichia coli]MBG3152667.1 hypothetical protein [Proteus mirabilis]MEB6858564.1 hypothetical protein [Proteus cibi]MEB7090013.1 hypothetical protein [Proteus cibi]